MSEAKQADRLTEECEREAVILREYCEYRFHVGQASTEAYSVHVELGVRGSEGLASPQDARSAAQAEFDKYVGDKTGMLYWRVSPEIDGRLLHEPDRWVYIYYMRFNISEKPRKD
jgi:hypothetical protein